MARKVVTWSNSQLNNSRCNFHFPCCTRIRVRIRFRYQRCDICVDLHMIYNYMLRMAVLDRIRGWFYVFIRGEDKRSEGDQSIIGIFRFVQAQNTLAD